MEGMTKVGMQTARTFYCVITPDIKITDFKPHIYFNKLFKSSGVP